MLNNDNNEDDVAWQERTKSKVSVKNGILFVVLGCVCLLLAWWTMYAAERIYASDYSDTLVVFYVCLFLILFAGPIYKRWVSFCLCGTFIFCLLALYNGIALMLLYARIKKGKAELRGEGVSRAAFVLCMISVIISVAVIALGIWIAVRLCLIGK